MSVVLLVLTSATLAGLSLYLAFRTRHAESALLRLRAYNLSMKEALPDPVFAIAPDGTITDLNSAAEAATGLSRQQLIGRRFSRIFTQPDLAETALKQTAADGVLHGFDLQIRGSEGRSSAVRLDATLYRDSSGVIAGVTATARDLTELKRTEEALHESEELLSLKLDSLLSDNATLSERELLNVLDVGSLQSLLEAFQGLTGTALAVFDLKGNILVQAGWQEICTRFHRANPISARACENDLLLPGIPRRGEYRIYRCQNGLWEVMTPLFISGVHVGNIYSGQFFFEGEEIDRERFAEQAARYGFNAKEYLAAVDRVPRVGREKINTVMEFLVKFAEQTSRLSYSTIKLAKAMSDQKRVEEALRDRERHFRNLLKRSPIPIAVISAEGRIDYLNDRFVETFGYTMDEVRDEEGWWLQAFPAPEYRERSRKAWQKVIRRAHQKGSDIETHEFRVTCRDGSLLTIEMFGTVIGSTRLVLFNDVTERKMAEDCITQLNEELDRRVEERTAQLAAAVRQQEAFSYSVSHDLRGPLRHINSYSAILLEEYGGILPAQGRHYLERLVAASSRMGNLIDDLLLLARVSRAEMKREKVDLSSIAADIAVRLREGEPDRDTRFLIADGLSASGDPVLLRQVLENLLENAWKYTGKKSKAVIEFGRRDFPEDGVFFVRDNGAGFDMSYRDKLFGPFERLHGDDYEGNGIGLATVHRIVTRHAGKVWAEGTVDRGATFFFTLQGEDQ